MTLSDECSSIWAFLFSCATPIPESGCWIYEGELSSNGYGRVKYKSLRFRAHRLAFKLANGSLPDGKLICHKCNVKSCINPSHLYAGTVKDNVRDMLRSGNHNNQRITHCPRGHEYSDSNTYFNPTINHRQCKTCQTARRKERTARERLLPYRPR